MCAILLYYYHVPSASDQFPVHEIRFAWVPTYRKDMAQREWEKILLLHFIINNIIIIMIIIYVICARIQNMYRYIYNCHNFCSLFFLLFLLLSLCSGISFSFIPCMNASREKKNSALWQYMHGWRPTEVDDIDVGEIEVQRAWVENWEEILRQHLVSVNIIKALRHPFGFYCIPYHICDDDKHNTLQCAHILTHFFLLHFFMLALPPHPPTIRMLWQLSTYVDAYCHYHYYYCYLDVHASIHS